MKTKREGERERESETRVVRTESERVTETSTWSHGDERKTKKHRDT